jgi:hypothetical protein
MYNPPIQEENDNQETTIPHNRSEKVKYMKEKKVPFPHKRQLGLKPNKSRVRGTCICDVERRRLVLRAVLCIRVAQTRSEKQPSILAGISTKVLGGKRKLVQIVQHQEQQLTQKRNLEKKSDVNHPITFAETYQLQRQFPGHVPGDARTVPCRPWAAFPCLHLDPWTRERLASL